MVVLVTTYTSGYYEDQTSCPCNCNRGSTHQVPPYIGSDYYCESGSDIIIGCSNVVLPDVTLVPRLHPLWCILPERVELGDDVLLDGQQCGLLEAPCCLYTPHATYCGHHQCKH